jgi:peptide/nickel transport system permease protein
LTRYALRRLAGLVATLVAASFVIFAALYVAPGDPIAFLTGGRTVAPETIAALRAQYHLDDPLPVAYLHWVAGAVHGDFGRSVISGESVATLLAPRVVNTAMLLAFASLMIFVVGVGSGVLAGLRPGAVDTSILLASTLALAIPSFVVAIVLIAVFAVNLGWFPVFGSGSSLPDRVYHLMLPSVALALASTAFVGRVTRAAVRGELNREHVQTAISRGIPYRLVVRRHVVRNSLIPISTVAGLTVAGLIAGAAIVERAFNLNGLGGYLVQAVQAKDFPVAQAICMILVAAFVVVNALVDVIYTVVDPRLKQRALAGGGR